MKRWGVAWVVGILAAILVLLSHSTAGNLLADSDTAVLLRTVHEKHAPFSWFLSDWPLYNHFYRPIPTLLFELDSHLYGNLSAAFGWTNAALAAGCVLMLFWFLRELTDRPVGAAGGALLFGSWQWSFYVPDWGWLSYFAVLTLIVGIARHKRNWAAYLPAIAVTIYLTHELFPIQPLNARILGWLPGRTASSMTLFALAAMAAYARFERLKRPAEAPEITPLTPPNTRSSVVDLRAHTRWPWAVVSVFLAALAFGCYEQAVMLPACLLGIAIAMRWKGYRPAWSMQAAFFALLVGYLWLRHQIIPPGVSQYQHQQLRTTAGALNALSDFVWPFGLYGSAMILLESGWLVLLQPSIYGLTLYLWSAIQTVISLRKEWILAMAGWLLSILAFLPMAWLKIFEHYYYWPLALRTVFIIALGSTFARLTSIAWRPPELQAPPRPVPAPGSLLHP